MIGKLPHPLAPSPYTERGNKSPLPLWERVRVRGDSPSTTAVGMRRIRPSLPASLPSRERGEQIPTPALPVDGEGVPVSPSSAVSVTPLSPVSVPPLTGGLQGRLVLALLLLLLLALALPTAAFADPRTHIVQPGDTLANIAFRFNTTVEELRHLNGLTDADLIRVGQELIVVPGERVHRVANGQTLLDIAAIYGLNAAQIADYNRLGNPDLLGVGQELVIPPRGAGASAPDSRPTRQRVWVPYRSQFDGSAYEQANCGPATLGMLMSFYGEHWTTSSIRRSIIEHSGVPSTDAGSTWEDIAYAARQRGFTTLGLFDGLGGYKKWTFADLMQQVDQGRPVMLLVRFWSLPGQGEKEWYGDHYIVFLGMTPGGEVVYHDSAWRGQQGGYMVMSREQLERAWTRTSIGVQYSAMVLVW